MKALFMIMASALALGCAAQTTEEQSKPGPAYEYSHTVSGLDSADCLELRSTCADVVLLCDGGEAFSSACRNVAGRSTDVYALPGAASKPDRPFGVASCVELSPCE